MLSAWRYDSDTKEVVVPRSYDPANGRSSKIQACKICREKKVRLPSSPTQASCPKVLRKFVLTLDSSDPLRRRRLQRLQQMPL